MPKRAELTERETRALAAWRAVAGDPSTTDRERRRIMAQVKRIESGRLDADQLLRVPKATITAVHPD
jgi:hypothetical protein